MGFVVKNPQLFIPFVALQLVLQVYCLYDLFRRQRMPGGTKVIWTVVIVGGEFLGSAAYLVFGRKD